MASFLPNFVAVLFILICVLLIIVVLLQKGRGGGLSAAFGGAGSSAFGTRTGDVFTWVTIVLTALFLVLAVLTTIAHHRPGSVVAAPAFSPPPQPIREPIPVRITCLTRGAEIYYTMDGTEPTDASLKYEDTPITVRPGQTVKARAYRAGWGESEVSVGAYPMLEQTATVPADQATQPALGGT